LELEHLQSLTHDSDVRIGDLVQTLLEAGREAEATDLVLMVADEAFEKDIPLDDALHLTISMFLKEAARPPIPVEFEGFDTFVWGKKVVQRNRN
jgi:hypothetical protein